MATVELLAQTRAILADLVAFESVTETSNLDIVRYIEARLARLGIESELTFDGAREKANLCATFGRDGDGGVALSGHTDVVPAGVGWSAPPFRLTEKDGKLFARGAADMKGFIACALACAPAFAAARLRRPIHLALSFDEESRSAGAPILVAAMRQKRAPAAAVVGEPTMMKIVAGHKAGFEATTDFSASPRTHPIRARA